MCEAKTVYLFEYIAYTEPCETKHGQNLHKNKNKGVTSTTH